MKMAWIVLAAAIPFGAALPACAQQGFDFKLLDKLGANAKESTNIALEGDTLKMATSFLGDDSSPLRKLTAVHVRSFEYAKAGQYNEADLEPVRAYLKTLQWNKIVDVKETEETSEIYLQPLRNNQLGGLAIVSSEPKEVTVVFISGQIDLSDIPKLGGKLGIPDVVYEHGGKKKSDDSKKD